MTTAAAITVLPEGERALVDAQLQAMDLDLLYVTFTIAADRYALARIAGKRPNLVDVMLAAVKDTAPQ
jgi:hypothetical protein